MNGFVGFVLRSVLVHTLTYLVFGLLARALLGYDALWKQPLIVDLYRPIDSNWVMAGPLIQPLRGALFGVALWPLHDTLFGNARGWLVIWGLFIAFAILGTAAAAPGSIEGVIYTQLPLRFHLIGSPEIYGQTLLYAWLLHRWERAAVAEQQAETGREANFIVALKASIVALLTLIGFILTGIITAALTDQSIETLQARAGSMVPLGVAIFCAFVVAFAIGHRAGKDHPVGRVGTFGLLYVAVALPMLVGALSTGASSEVASTLLSALAAASLAWLATRTLWRA